MATSHSRNRTSFYPPAAIFPHNTNFFQYMHYALKTPRCLKDVQQPVLVAKHGKATGPQHSGCPGVRVFQPCARRERGIASRHIEPDSRLILDFNPAHLRLKKTCYRLSVSRSYCNIFFSAISSFSAQPSYFKPNVLTRLPYERT